MAEAMTTSEEKFERYGALSRELLGQKNITMPREDAILDELDDIWYSLSEEETAELRARMEIGRSKCRKA